MKTSNNSKSKNLFAKYLFWQPNFDFLNYLNRSALGRYSIIILNYVIWFFLFAVAYFLIKNQTNIFWQLLVATVIGEIIEKVGKSHALWSRPLFQRHDPTPIGLVDCWYKSGSFPSGHTIKVTYFFLFLLQYHFFSPTIFLEVSLPLLFFRILVGFHYPIDMLGGLLFGYLIWALTHQIVAPDVWTHLIHVIFNLVFFIK